MYFYFSKILAPFLNPTNVIVILIIFFYFFSKKYKLKNLKKINKILLSIIFFIAFFPIGNFGIKFLELKYINQEKINNIDNIIVLAGSENILTTKITNKTNLGDGSERLISVVNLSNKYPNANIYFLGGDGHLIKNNIDETDVARSFFKDVNFNYDKIIFIDDTRNTIENLESLKKYSLIKQVNVIITSAFHMKRVELISKKIGLNLIPYAVDFRSISTSNFLNYFQTFSLTNNLAKFDLFVREIIGIIAFKIFF